MPDTQIIEELELDVTYELQRMGAELLAFPFVPRSVQYENGRRRYIERTPGRLGALVYHDIMAEGGSGSRREVRIILDRVLIDEDLAVPDEYRTGCAAVSVAKLRLFNPSKVSAPMLPEDSARTYRPEHRDLVDAEKLKKLRLYMRGFSASLRSIERRAQGTKWEVNHVRKARRAWRYALEAMGDETPLMFAEQEEVARITTALRAVRRVPLPVRVATTRLITLEDLEDDNFA